jgi:hydroxyacylglutathione hydrolase
LTIKHFYTGPIDVNTYLVYDSSKKAFIVDPGGECGQMLREIEKEGLKPEYIILTHGHADHIGGIESLKEKFPDIKTLVYEDDAEMLESPRLNTSLSLFGKPISIKADILVKDKDELQVGNTLLTFRHTPGHSLGSMCILGDGFVFSGDTLFRTSIGRTDFYGGSYKAIIKSIKEVLFSLPDDTVVYPGHMEATTIEFEKRYNPFLQEGAIC